MNIPRQASPHARAKRESGLTQTSRCGSHPGDDLVGISLADEVEPVVGDRVVPLVVLRAGDLPGRRVRIVDVDVLALGERDAPVADLVADAGRLEKVAGEKLADGVEVGVVRLDLDLDLAPMILPSCLPA